MAKSPSKLMRYGIAQARQSAKYNGKEVSEKLAWIEKEHKEGAMKPARYKMLKKYWTSQADWLKKPIAERAKQEIAYLKLRTQVDVGAKKKLLELTRPPMKFKGYVIGRKLLDGSRRKNFTYYPREVRGQPPFHFRTKAQAMKKLETLKEKGKFPGTESNAVVFKFTRPTYLDRY